MSRLSVFIQAPAPPLFKKNIFDANFVSGQNGMAWKSITVTVVYVLTMNLWNFSVFNFQLKPLGPNERVTCTTTCLIRWGER